MPRKNKDTENRMNRENCNKAQCKSCIFRTDGDNAKIGEKRMDEIRNYLATGKSSHICHVTEKTCYGALEYQADMFNRIGIIPENSVKSLLDTAAKVLQLEQ